MDNVHKNTYDFMYRKHGDPRVNEALATLALEDKPVSPTWKTSVQQTFNKSVLHFECSKEDMPDLFVAQSPKEKVLRGFDFVVHIYAADIEVPPECFLIEGEM